MLDDILRVIFDWFAENPIGAARENGGMPYEPGAEFGGCGTGGACDQ